MCVQYSDNYKNYSTEETKPLHTKGTKAKTTHRIVNVCLRSSRSWRVMVWSARRISRMSGSYFAQFGAKTCYWDAECKYTKIKTRCQHSERKYQAAKWYIGPVDRMLGQGTTDKSVRWFAIISDHLFLPSALAQHISRIPYFNIF